VNRATLLHVLDQPTALGPGEVRELEQLAQTFPYCQTAHLLLAKAAHDQGTMLAGQRLRRAATYAADRALLRRLIEQEEPAAALVAEAALPPVAEAVDALPAEPAQAVAATERVAAPAAAPPATEPAAVAPEPPIPVALAAALEPALILVPGPVLEASAAETPPPAPPTALLIDAPLNGPRLDAAPADEQFWGGADLPTSDSGTSEAPTDSSPAETLVAEVPPAAEAAGLETHDEPPATAPAIRPPVEVGEARFEFGLAPEVLSVPVTYELPGLVDEWAASAVTRSLGTLAPPEAPVPPAPALTPAAFTGDGELGYGLGESSRLGFSVQLLRLLSATAGPADELTTCEAAALPAAAALPPTGDFFEPDPLLLNHWAAHCPPAPALPSSFDLINNFLRRQPRLTRPAMLPPTPAAQPDLSVRSTRAEPDLASESLARILVRQGKTARAIEIYEKLMVKQPEKMAYFASQIQQLQPRA